MSDFDPDIVGFIEGSFTSITLTSPAGFPPPAISNLVIDPTQPFEIALKWRLEGPLVPLWLAALGGNWSVSAYAESVGPGPEVILRQDSLAVSAGTPIPPSPTDVEWTTTLTVPANVLDEENPGNPAGPSGVYKLASTVFLDSTLGVPGFDIVGFIEGPVIKVESPI